MKDKIMNKISNLQNSSSTSLAFFYFFTTLKIDISDLYTKLKMNISSLYYRLPLTGWPTITIEESETFSKEDLINLKEHINKAATIVYVDLEKILGVSMTKEVFRKYFKGCNKSTEKERRADFFVNMAVYNTIEQYK